MPSGMPSSTPTCHPCKAPAAVPLPCAGWHCHLSSVPKLNLRPALIIASPGCWSIIGLALGPRVPSKPRAVSLTQTPLSCQPLSGPRCEGSHRAGGHCAHPRHALIPQPGRAGMGPSIATSSGASLRLHTGLRVPAHTPGCVTGPAALGSGEGARDGGGGSSPSLSCPGVRGWRNVVVNHCEGGPGFFHEPRVKTCCCLFSLLPEGPRQPQRRRPCRHVVRPRHDILRP